MGGDDRRGKRSLERAVKPAGRGLQKGSAFEFVGRSSRGPLDSRRAGSFFAGKRRPTASAEATRASERHSGAASPRPHRGSAARQPIAEEGKCGASRGRGGNTPVELRPRATRSGSHIAIGGRK